MIGQEIEKLEWEQAPFVKFKGHNFFISITLLILCLAGYWTCLRYYANKIWIQVC